MNRSLARCPTCGGALSDPIKAAMGLRTGELLNGLCPGRNGPSDIDHVLHNRHTQPERVMFLEYKRGNGGLTQGQAYLKAGLNGDWEERSTGRLLSIRYVLLGSHTPDAKDRLGDVVAWVWPEALEEAIA